MNCEETGLQKSISDSAEMRQVFCKTISHFILSHFFTPFYLLCFHSSSVSSGFTDTLLTTTLPFISCFLHWERPSPPVPLASFF